jgi:hypothetical protein
MKSRRPVAGSKPRRGKRSAAKSQPRATFIGTRLRSFTMTLRGQAVQVELVPAVSTTTHVNFAITISQRGEVLDWVLSRAELESIGRAAGMHTTPETSH